MDSKCCISSVEVVQENWKIKTNRKPLLTQTTWKRTMTSDTHAGAHFPRPPASSLLERQQAEHWGPCSWTREVLHFVTVLKVKVKRLWSPSQIPAEALNTSTVGRAPAGVLITGQWHLCHQSVRALDHEDTSGSLAPRHGNAALCLKCLPCMVARLQSRMSEGWGRKIASLNKD